MEKIPENIQVNISPDKMKAFIIISASDYNNEVPSLMELLNYLKENEVVYGINKDILNVIISQGLFNQEVLVAEGTYPVDGIGGSLKLHFNIKRDKKPAILEDGRVDFRNLGLIENVRKGQKLCSIIPPLPGEDGKTVTGEVIASSKGKPAKSPIGKNVELTEGLDGLIASIDGQVSYLNDRIHVYPYYEVSSDVDNSTGNINFVGNVIIRGSILSGFQVEAGGNIEIWGVVEGATVKAGGDILIRRGVQGNSKATIISEGNIVARYIEHSNIEAKNDIRAEAIMHSTVKCGGKLELSGRKGLLVGGNIKVRKEIKAKVIGSQMATFTEIEVGVPPELREISRSLKEEVAKLESDLKKAEQIINILLKLNTNNMLTEDKKKLLEKSLKTKQFYVSRISQLKYESDVVEEQLN
ncbi:MAG TPA: FapA family protein, partial [Clostridiales bacterium]|nr:FapA family protein [Clostridiales bacterium]